MSLTKLAYLSVLLIGSFDEAPLLPPYQRVVAGEDLRLLSDQEARLDAARAADNFSEVIAAAEQILALRRRCQGSDHWETFEARLDLADLREQSKWPQARRRELLRAAEQSAEADKLAEGGRYAAAEELERKVLAQRQAILGNDHRLVGTSWTNLGWLNNALGQAAEAESCYREALRIFRKSMGEDHPNTGQSYNNLASALRAQRKYAEAEVLTRRALELSEHFFGPMSSQTAGVLSNLASGFTGEGRFAEAEQTYRRALALYRQTKGEDHSSTGIVYGNLAEAIQAQGRPAVAEAYFRKAAEISKRTRGEQHPQAALAVANLASNLYLQQRYKEAGALYQQALAVFVPLLGEEHRRTQSVQGLLAAVLDAQGEYAQGEQIYRKLLAVRERSLQSDDPDLATTRNNLGLNLYEQERFAEAEALVARALASRRRVLGEHHPDTFVCKYNLGMFLAVQGRLDQAGPQFQDAALSFETARLRAGGSGLTRATFASDRSPYRPLALILAMQDRHAEAWQALEVGLGRGLLDDLALRTAQLSPMQAARRDELVRVQQSVDQAIQACFRQPDLKPTERVELNKLLAQRVKGETELAKLAAEASKREVCSLADVQSALPEDAALVVWVDILARGKFKSEHWACVVRKQQPPSWVRLPGSGPDGQWLGSDEDLAEELRAELIRKGPSLDRLVKRLAKQRLEPLKPHLEGICRLIVVPVGSMAGVPVELLAPNNTVSYAPSATILTRLGKTPLRVGRPSLLALGDPAFDLSAARADDRLDEPTRSRLAALPGTRREIEAIRKLFPNAMVLLGKDASEERLDQLAKSGALRNYQVLHLATHGQVDDRRAEHCALLLMEAALAPMQQGTQGPAFDGRLEVREILRDWDLAAELVVLSACETGLGQSGGGEGLLGFSQAILARGSQSLLVSLWPVSDTATSLLMTRFYENWLGTGMAGPPQNVSKADALREAKDWLSKLKRKDIEAQIARLPEGARGLKLELVSQGGQDADDDRPFGHPYYWSAFILMGDPR